MQHILLALALLCAVNLAACATPPSPHVQATAGTATSFSRTALAGPSTNTASDEAQIRAVVEGFGKALQGVSLQSADPAEQIKQQYSRYVSPSLLETWMNEPLSAPGRVVSSPWPDRIEISTLTREGPDRYAISGYVVEMTSLEVVKGGAAVRKSVRLAVRRSLGGWLITEYVEDR